MTRKLTLILIFIVALLSFNSCHDVESWDNDVEGNFDALWTVIDRHYCFLDEKNIDWDSVYVAYKSRIRPDMGVVEFFDVCSRMLDELKDGHVNLTSPFATSYYKKWWSDYPQNYDDRLVDQYYLNFGGFTRNGMTYAVVADSVGYVRYPSFSYVPGESTLDWALYMLRDCCGIIIDIRDNGGGALTSVEMFVRRFINRRILAGYICHKSGPGHNDFSEPYAFYYDPTDRIRWDKPVVILTNRSTFSAANNFVSIMRQLPQVTIVGDRTGGGSGMPFTSEIPCGWSVRFSGSPMYDADMQSIEDGVWPDVRVDLDKELALDGIDTMLDKAIELLTVKQ